MTAAARIRSARLAEGLTQAQLARRLGITQPSVARLEAAGDAMTVETLRRSLRALGRDLELAAPSLPSGADESLLRENLALAPAERLQRMLDGHARFASLAAAARQARERA